MKDLKQRVITAVIGIALLLFILIKGGIVLKTAIAIISLEAARELYFAFKKININLNMYSMIIGTLLLLLFSLYNISLEFSIIFVLFSSFIFTLFSDKYSLEDTAYTTFSFIYGPYLLNLLSGLENRLLYLVFIIAFSTDTFAYFAGNLFGKHKLIPKVSPNKSVEGAIGGIIGCLLISLIYFYYLGLDVNILTVLFIIIASISGQVGDLIASKIKRVTGIKDYAKILPGHGGILDRFDSSILVIPFVYILQFVLSV